MRHTVLLSACLLVLLALPAPLHAAAPANVTTILIDDHPAPRPWPRFGVLAYGSVFMLSLESAMDKAEAWGIGSLRLEPHANTDLTGLQEQLARAPNCRPWLTVPARELDNDARKTAKYALDFLASLDPASKNIGIEPINEGYTRSGFGNDLGLWTEFHERVFLELRKAGRSNEFITNPLVRSDTLSYWPSNELGRLQHLIDVHQYIGVHSDDLDLDGDPRFYTGGRASVSPTSIQHFWGAWNNVPRSIRSGNSLTASKWTISIYCYKHESADAPEGAAEFYVGDTLLYTLIGAEHRYGETVTETIAAQASGKCTVRTKGGMWKGIRIHGDGKPFVWLTGNDWLIHAMQRFKPAPAILGWLDGSWAIPRWGPEPRPMPVVIGEAGAPWWGGEAVGQYSLGAAMMFLRQYQVYAEHPGILAVHWHATVPARQTPFGVAMEWFAKVRTGTMRRIEIQGDDLYALASDTGVLLLNPAGERTVLIKGLAPASAVLRRISPAMRRRRRADISAALTMHDVRVRKTRVRIPQNGIVQLRLSPGIAFLQTRP